MALDPVLRLVEAHVLAAERLHGDDTTVPVLARGKTQTGRIWTYVRDDRPCGRSVANRLRGHVPEAFASKWGLQAKNGLRGEVCDGRGRGRLDDVEIEPRLKHELELFLAVWDGEVARAVGHD